MKTLTKTQRVNALYYAARQREDQEIARRKINSSLAIDWRPSKRSVKGNGKGIGRRDLKKGGIEDMRFRKLKFNAEFI